MPIKSVLGPCLTALPLLLPHQAAIAQQEPGVSAQTVVETFEQTFGVHPGQRRNHIKGTCAAGSFVGTKEAAALSRSRLFSGQEIPVVARFSLAGGNPKAPDTARSPRGLALEFRLADGALHHMTMLNLPIFAAATPKTFYENILATRPDPATGKPDPVRIKAFREAHPDTRPLAEYLAAHNPPASYASSVYYGIHTFKLVDTKGTSRNVRWRFAPRDGEKALSDAEMASAGANFLEPALLDRLKQGPVRWDMIVSLGEPGDPEDNPTLAWPEKRTQVLAGTLTLTAASTEKGAACEPINFDPLVMADGIAPSSDPILHFRSPAYAVSYGRRASGK